MALSPAQLYRRLRMGPRKRKLLDAGVIDETGVHTQEGRNLLWAVLFEQFEDELVAAVEAHKADTEAVEKAAKKSKE